MKTLIATLLLAAVGSVAQAEIRLPSGSFQQPYITPGGFDPTGASAVSTSSNAYTVPITVPAVCISTGIGFVVGTANGQMDVGIYNAAGQKLISAGATNMPAAGFKTITWATPVTLYPGYYYAAVTINNTTGTLTRVSSNSPYGWYGYTSSYPLPASLTIPGTVSSRAYWLMIICKNGINQ